MRKTKSNFTTIVITILLSGSFLFSLSGCGRSSRSKPQATPTRVQSLRPQAETIITEALTDNDPSIRTKAIEVIAETKQIHLMPKVVKYLNDPVVPVRFSAALAVGDTEYLLAKKDVAALLKDRDESVRIAAAYALYKLSDKSQIELIQKAIKQRDLTVRANATLLLGKCGDKRFIGLLYWAMNDRYSDYKVSLQAAQAAAKLKHEKIYPKLWTMLISSYADDRVMGIRGMGALGTPEAKIAITTMLDDDILEVRLVAAEQLGKLNDNLGEQEVISVFEQNLTANMDEESRQRTNVLAALAIGQIKSKKLIKFLPKLINDPDKQVRIAATKAIFLYAKQ